MKHVSDEQLAKDLLEEEDYDRLLGAVDDGDIDLRKLTIDARQRRDPTVVSNARIVIDDGGNYDGLTIREAMEKLYYEQIVE